MTNPGPVSHPLTGSGAATSGGRQSVVELCGASPGRLVFWSRLRFEVGAEVQVRVRADSLPVCLRQHLAEASPSGWAWLRGRVVHCEAVRRADGSVGFRVSVLVRAENVTAPPPTELRAPEIAFVQHPWLGGVRQGWC